MKFLRLLLLFVILVSCDKKAEVQLPLLGEKGITEVYNNSQIWIFFEVENGDTIGKLNKNNKITDTNLFFNIDRRLPLREVLPAVSKIKFDVENAKVHRSDGKRFYFSYADTVSKQFSLFDFSNIEYVFQAEPFEKKRNDSVKRYSVIDLKPNILLLNGKPIVNQIDSLIKFISMENVPKRLLLRIHEKVSFQDYLSLRNRLYHKGISIENIEYIYKELNLP